MSYKLLDLGTKRPIVLKEKDLRDKLSEVKGIMQRTLDELKTVAGYQLDTIKVSFGIKFGALVFTAEGGIELTFNRPKP